MTVSRTWFPSIALLALAGACTNAKFALVGGSQTGTTTSTGTGTQSTCYAPIDNCDSKNSGNDPCDPVCQTGSRCDWCDKKCTYDAKGTVICAGFKDKEILDPCTPEADGSDDCVPGSICLNPISGGTNSFCFQLCRSSADCDRGPDCGERELAHNGAKVRVCDPPYAQAGGRDSCDPVENRGCASNRTCFLVSPERQADGTTGHSRTVCEFSYTDARDGKECNSARDCMYGYTCVDDFCRLVSDQATGCPVGTTYNDHGSEYGYCTDSP
jgi:hypothetical protein